MSKSHDFIEWLRAHNEQLPAKARTQFRGLDIYSLGASIAAVLAYLDRVDPDEAKTARRRYGCLTPWQEDPGGYGRAALHLGESPCEDGVVAELRTCFSAGSPMCAATANPSSTPRRMRASFWPPSITIG